MKIQQLLARGQGGQVVSDFSGVPGRALNSSHESGPPLVHADFISTCSRSGHRLYTIPLPRPTISRRLVRRTPVVRSALKAQLQKDGIDYLLVQFVDVHGAPKVKMVPAEMLDDVADVGAGFAGG